MTVAWMSVAVCAACMACSAAMAAIVLYDDAARIIPRNLCWLLGVAGIALQACSGGMLAVAFGLAWAIAFYLVSSITLWWIDGRKGKKEPSLGGGDVRCMAALSLATGPGAPVGFAACFTAAALWAAIERVRRRMKAGEAFAFAPFLALWLAVGVLVVI